MILNRFKELRTHRGLSQSGLANYLNITQQAVGKWERGKSEPSNSDLVNLSNIFNVTTDYLLGRTDSPQPLQAPALPPSEQVFLKKYRTLTEEQKGMVENQIDYLCGLNEAAKQEDAS